MISETKMDKFNIYKNLSILYAQYNQENKFNQIILKSISKIFHSSISLEDTLNKYRNFKEINGFYFDLIIIENRFGLDICHKILEINSSQRIIVKINIDNNEKLSDFYVNGFDDFIYEPLSKLSLEKTIYNRKEKMDYSNLLSRSLDNKNDEITNIVSEYENKLEQRSEFFASMSHEIRTPMNAIMGMSQILMEDKLLNRNQLETAKTINRASNMLLSTINDILDFSKIEAGKLSLENSSFDLNMILSYLADMTSLKAKEKGISLTFDIDNRMGKNYLGDSMRISQILLNLIGNAIKFTDKGSVQLSVKIVDLVDKKSTIQFEVSDTGIGIGKEQLKNLFKSYTQASDDTSRKYGGTGLGLRISKQLVELMDGKIWVESELGVGTTFFVRITLDSDSEKRNYRLPSKDIMEMKVLIIDSSLESTASLSKLIEYFHMPVTTASNINDAKTLIDEKIFDIVFVDSYMLDSLDIQSYKLKSNANIVLIDDWKNILKSEKLYSMGVDEILKRPFTQQMVFEIISSLYSINGIPNNTQQRDKYSKDSVKMLGKHKILIAEDNKINQKVMSGLLADTELEIEFADDGQKALDKLQNSAILHELIFMDINMPNLDGYMATQTIRKNSLFDNIPIIGLSAYGTDEDIKKAKDVGMQGYLQKPIDVKALYEILIKYLKQRSL